MAEKCSRTWGNLTLCIFPAYKSARWGPDKVSHLLSFRALVLLLSMDVKLQMWSSQRFFMSMSYSPDLTDTLHFPVFKRKKKLKRRSRETHTRSTSPSLCFFNLTGLDTAHKSELIFWKRPKPTESEDPYVPGIKITSDKWHSHSRHAFALSSRFAASFKNLSIPRTV